MISIRPDMLRGSFVPLVTPFENGALDLESFERLIERQIELGSDGLVITGTTGEPTSLTGSERVELYGRAVNISAGRVPVIAATGSPNQEETLALTRSAENAGANAVLVLVPAFVKPSQEGLCRHFVEVARATELPLLIYDIPGRASAGIEAETVARIAAEAENLVGLKSARPDLDVVTDLLLQLGDEFRLFCGVETLSYPFLALGGAGLMSAVGNLLPDRVAGLCQAVAQGDHSAALTIHRELFAVNRAVFFATNPVPLKAMLEIEGVAGAEVRPPLAPADGKLKERLRELLANYRSEYRPVPVGG